MRLLLRRSGAVGGDVPDADELMPTASSWVPVRHASSP
jgi:hypothetical protein